MQKNNPFSVLPAVAVSDEVNKTEKDELDVLVSRFQKIKDSPKHKDTKLLDTVLDNLKSKQKIKVPRITSKTFNLTKSQERECRESFKFIDEDGSGSITEKEWRIAMRNMGFEMSKSEARAMVGAIDQDGNGTIEVDEYIYLVKQRLADKFSTNELKRAFQVMYQVLPPTVKSNEEEIRPGILPSLWLQKQKELAMGEPRLTAQHIRELALLLDEKFSEKEISEMILEADKDGDGEVTESDFIRVMKKSFIY